MANMKEDSKKINILDLRDSPWMDGPGRTILDTAESINKEKYNLIVGAFDGGKKEENDYIVQARKRSLPVVVIKEKSAFDLDVIKQIKEFVTENDIAILHTHEFRSNLFGLICAKQLGIPVITTYHGWITNSFKASVYKLVDRILARFFNEITTVSEKVRDQLSSILVPKEKITVINNALKLERYTIDRDNSTLRQELGLSKECVLIANIGRLSPEKGQEILIRSAVKVIAEFPNVKLLFIGIGKDEEKLKLLSRELGIENNVLFLGFRSDMINVYNSTDLVVQSSFTEGMPNVVLEALAMGVPVIATNVGGTAEVMEHDISGKIISPNSQIKLEEAIRHFLNNPEIYKTMSEKGIERVRRHFDFNTRTKFQEEIYSNMLQK